MMTVDEWIAAYGAAWRSKDDVAAAALFAADGLYLSSPTKPPHAGREALLPPSRTSTCGSGRRLSRATASRWSGGQ